MTAIRQYAVVVVRNVTQKVPVSPTNTKQETRKLRLSQSYIHFLLNIMLSAFCTQVSVLPKINWIIPVIHAYFEHC